MNKATAIPGSRVLSGVTRRGGEASLPDQHAEFATRPGFVLIYHDCTNQLVRVDTSRFKFGKDNFIIQLLHHKISTLSTKNATKG